jgi:hypothetical protein
MGERIGRIGRMQTDFFLIFCLKFIHLDSKKSVRIRPIRPIRSPIVSQPIIFSKNKNLVSTWYFQSVLARPVFSNQPERV